MTHKKRILLIILAAILALLILVCYQQQNNLKALWIYLTTDSETVSRQMEENRAELQQKLEQENSVTIKAPSREDNEALLNGQVSAEEVKEAIGIPQTTKVTEPPKQTDAKQTSAVQTASSAVTDKSDTATQTSTSEPPKPPEKTADEIVNECVAELYACQVDLMAKLGGMKQTYLNRWNKLPASQRTNSKKIELGMEGLNQCYSLEVTVDGQVQGILDKYEPQLKEIGADTSVLDSLWDYYCQVKASEKAYYLDKYL